ncbi:hypothetical protein [Streptomyces jeddahensis]|uniref:Uncharacterized protein n=1 Tax=Streptomyces jeddahensis TaxID=1716141 RepID=A0A177HTF4_9ACTN|nr:hypothetical protein [Streptomyces jeddahensis]OAH13787.1 hypothetical protein STSP_27650 [Streptomyces jeddahensis]
MSEQDAERSEETWDPGVARWHSADGDYVLPRVLRELPEPWNGVGADWPRIARLPRTDERLAEARRVLSALLDDPEAAPYVPQPPSPGLLRHAWEEFQRQVAARMPRTDLVTWAGVDGLVLEGRERDGLYPLQRHVLDHVEVVMLDLIAWLRDDIADSVLRWLALDPAPGRFAGWAVGLAERCVVADIGADSAIELLGAIGDADAVAALRRLADKTDTPASWENADAALGMLAELEDRGT